MNRLLYSVLLLLASSSVLAQIVKPKEISDDPYARIEYDRQRLCDPITNEIPAEASRKEWEFSRKLPKYDPFAAKGGAATLSTGWAPIGPYNVSGRVQAVTIDIKNANNILAGTASGGIWRTLDGGLSWVKTTLPNEQQTVSAIVQDTRSGKENIWYYSTSELMSTTARRHTSNIRTHSTGNGMYRSTDNGTTWQPLLSTQTRDGNAAPAMFQGIWNLALDHTNTGKDIIYAACLGGITRSTDGGSSWALVLGDTTKYCFNSEIVIATNGVLYAALGSLYNGTVSPMQGIWRSTDGTTWKKIGGNAAPTRWRRSRLASAPSNSNVLYFISEDPIDWAQPDAGFVSDHVMLKYTYLSGDGIGLGGNWEDCTLPFDSDPYGYTNSLSGYALTLAVSPVDENKVFLGATSLYYSDHSFSDNTYQKLGGYSDATEGTMHPDVHAITFSIFNPEHIFVGTDGGIATEDYNDGDGYWTTLSDGLISTQAYHSSLDHGTDFDNLVITGFQDNNTFLTSSSALSDPWYPIAGGDGTTTAICDGGKMLFASWQLGNIHCFITNGSDLDYAGRLPDPATATEANFYTMYVLEPILCNQLYKAVYDELWRYNDLSVIPFSISAIPGDWSQISAVRQALRPSGSFISTFGFSHTIANLLFLGTSNGKVYSIHNADKTTSQLKDISSDVFPKNAFVAGIEVDPLDEKNIVVVFSNYNVQSIFRTTDGGTSWKAVSGNLEEHSDGTGSGPSVRCVKILHTKNSTIYYVGTGAGLFSTTIIDGMNTVWIQEAATEIGDLIIESIDARQGDGRMIVSSQGGGVFMNTITARVKPSPRQTNNSLSVEQNYPNPFSGESKIRFTLTKPSTISVELFNTAGQSLGIVVNKAFESGSSILELSSMLPQSTTEGNYFLRFSTQTASLTKIITILKP